MAPYIKAKCINVTTCTYVCATVYVRNRGHSVLHFHTISRYSYNTFGSLSRIQYSTGIRTGFFNKNYEILPLYICIYMALRV